MENDNNFIFTDLVSAKIQKFWLSDILDIFLIVNFCPLSTEKNHSSVDVPPSAQITLHLMLIKCWLLWLAYSCFFFLISLLQRIELSFRRSVFIIGFEMTKAIVFVSCHQWIFSSYLVFHHQLNNIYTPSNDTLVMMFFGRFFPFLSKPLLKSIV